MFCFFYTITDHPLKRRATRRARAGSVRNRTGARKLARCASVRSNRSIHTVLSLDEPGTLPGTNRANPNGKPGGVLLLSGSDVEAGKSQLLDKDDDQQESVLLTPPKTSVKQSILDMVNKGKF